MLCDIWKNKICFNKKYSKGYSSYRADKKVYADADADADADAKAIRPKKKQYVHTHIGSVGVGRGHNFRCLEIVFLYLPENRL